jgi:hypothetical protein
VIAATSEPVETDSSDCPNRPVGSSPSGFDPSTGTYAAQKLSLTTNPPALTFTVVRWLSGEDARQAWLQANPGTSNDSLSNDYLIVDGDALPRSAPVGDAAAVRLLHGTTQIATDSVDGLGPYLAAGNAAADTYWLTFDRGAISEICQQYRP